MSDIELTATLARGLSEACHLLAENYGCPKTHVDYPTATVIKACFCDEYYCPPKADCWYRLLTRNTVREVVEND